MSVLNVDDIIDLFNRHGMSQLHPIEPHVRVLVLEIERLREALALTESRRASLARRDGLSPEGLDAVWSMIVHSWSIETREFFEREGPKEFAWPVDATPLMKAIHHMWKRDRNVAALTDERDALRARVAELEQGR